MREHTRNLNARSRQSTIVLAALLLLASACGGPTAPETGCTSQGDCAPGQVCADGVCRADTTPECTGNDDCAEGDFCDDGTCRTDETPECVKDDDCTGDELCDDGRCVEPECVKDDECTGADLCQEGRCVDPECVERDDCEGDELCDDGRCVPPECTSNGDCAPGNHCDDGVCLPGACREADKNACGGCAVLTGAKGDACGSCNKDELVCAAGGESLACNGDTPCSAPSVTTDAVTNITQYSARLVGTLVASGDSAVSAHGFCYGQTTGPSLDDGMSPCTDLGAAPEAGTFHLDVESLELETPYFVRAYATNDVGVSYGAEQSFTTLAAVLPAVSTLSATAPEAGVVRVEASLDHPGIPVHRNHGICLGLEQAPALGDEKSNCVGLGTAEATGVFSEDFIGLAPGATYYVRAFGESEEGVTYGEELSVTLAPATPVIDTITDATRADVVALSWTEVPHATGYHVYRDGVRITDEPVTEPDYEDAGASAGGAPESTGLNPVASSNLPDRVRVSWSAAVVPAGAVHEYKVTAINAGGESAESAPRQGRRAASPVTSHEVSINGGNWLSTTAASYDDLTAPAGSISQANPSASQGTSSTAVNLSLSGAEPAPGASVNYRVRARNAVGVGAESDVVQGHRAEATLTFQWQRSSGTTDAGYSNLSGATGREYADATAPADGSLRFYRVLISGGPSVVTTNGVSGFREVGLPELTTNTPTALGQTTFTVSGSVTALGATAITQHGYCWSTSSTPTYVPGGTNTNCHSFGARSTVGAITAHSPAGLTGGTIYYVRTFAQVTKGGNLFVAYGPTRSALTIPATPAAPTASTNIIEHVRLTWPRGSNVTKYEVRRGGSLIATLDATSSTMTYDDTGAPTPGKPAAPTSSTFGYIAYCSGTTIGWTPPAAPAAGANASYTLVAVNGSGKSSASTAAIGRRASAPILGYKLKNIDMPDSPMLTTTSTALFTPHVRPPTITAGTITASDGASHHTYVLLTSTGQSKSAPPVDTFHVTAYNAIGDGAAYVTTNSRPSFCNLITQWQKGTSIGMGLYFYYDMSGAVGSPYQDTSAPASGQSQMYKARYYVDGADLPEYSDYSASNSGHRLARIPTVVTNDQASGATRTSIQATAITTDRGVPEVTTNDFGICISTSGSPTPGGSGVTCRSGGLQCGYTGLAGNQLKVTCTFSGLAPGTPFFVQAFGRNAAATALGGMKIYSTLP